MTSNLLDCIGQHSLTGIKAGNERQTFLDIWMVVVEDRIFARSWGFAERSWYNTFLENPQGQLKCGDKVVEIIAIPIFNEPELNEKINQAYLSKYNFGEKAFYAQGIIQAKHIEKTMEFKVV